MKVLAIGASKNIGYFATQRLLASGATVTFLLRNVDTFQADDTMKPYISSGKARTVKGDAKEVADVERAWAVAADGDDGAVDVVLFTIGAGPKFSITHGIQMDQPTVCTTAILNVLSTFPKNPDDQPKIIAISSTGLSKSSHATLPLALKPLYKYLLATPHLDKIGMERVIAHAAGWQWTDKEPTKTILPEGWQTRLPDSGFLKRVVVLRPALFTDGACKADGAAAGKGKGYRVGEQDLTSSYTISRRDVAHFIVEDCLARWEYWEGKIPRIAY